MSPWITVTFVFGAAISAAAAWDTQYSNERMTTKALAMELQETADAVVQRIELYQFGLRGLRGAIQAVEVQGMTLEAFQRYSATRDIPREFPGARGFGYIARVAPEQQAAFVEAERRQGRPDFTVHQFEPYAGEHFLVRYISPAASNQSAIGLDIASDPVRRQAALEAMRSGTVQLTRPIVFFQSSGENQNAFLILLPVYRDAATPATLAERETSTIGWSYAALQIDEVLENLGVYHVGLNLKLSDITDAQSPALFYDNGDALANETAVASQEVEREVFGRHWRLQMQAHPAFVASLNQTSPRLVLVLGLLISGMIAALLGMLDNMRRRRIELFTDQARMAAIVESSFDGIVGKDLDGVIRSWNKGAELIF
ncbi:MAG: CHASE domain-containing protein, partial [Pseudomonas sp.]